MAEPWEPFHQAIGEEARRAAEEVRPHGDGPSLVYADRLDERGTRSGS